MMHKTAAGSAAPLAWFKSSYSSGDGNDCVEIATPLTVHIRDSKQQAGPRLVLAPGAWSAFVAYASRG
ncbi:DUF397 domain-containing protein [Streptomyces cinereospinus]|uniref:DUF397 domain-containing protein n=1 Tax=Streptomyces cinereospinus TaxID=285561 RepID=A0ABV5MUR4_9ACTN